MVLFVHHHTVSPPKLLLLLPHTALRAYTFPSSLRPCPEPACDEDTEIHANLLHVKGFDPCDDPCNPSLSRFSTPPVEMDKALHSDKMIRLQPWRYIEKIYTILHWHFFSLCFVLDQYQFCTPGGGAHLQSCNQVHATH